MHAPLLFKYHNNKGSMMAILIAVHKNKNYDADFIFFFTDILSLLSASFYPFFWC